MKFLLLLLTFTFSSATFAAGKSAQDLVESGLKAYAKNDARAAIQIWIKGSGLEGSKNALSQANSLKQIEDYYGKYENYEIVRSHKLSKRSTIILFVMNYSKGITYAKFQAYKTKSNVWVATEFKFHTEAARIWPKADVYGK